MGKTQKRNNNVSQKKRSPVRTSLKLRKEKKMKGGNIDQNDIDMIKNRNTNFQDTILELVNKYVTNMNESGYIIEKSDQLNTMIKAYFNKNEDFSTNYRTIIIEVITTLKTSLDDLENKNISTYESEREELNKHKILIQYVNDFIKIMEAIAEGAEIDINTDESDATDADDGITDLYGVMYKPFDFDPDKKYPIISYVYPGPQVESFRNDFTISSHISN